MLCYVVLCCVVLCCIVFRCVVLRCVPLCCVVLCDVMRCDVIIYFRTLPICDESWFVTRWRWLKHFSFYKEHASYSG